MAARPVGNRAASTARCGLFVISAWNSSAEKLLIEGCWLICAVLLLWLLGVLLGRPPRHSRRVLTGPRGSHTKSRDSRLQHAPQRERERERERERKRCLSFIAHAAAAATATAGLGNHVNYTSLAATSLDINFRDLSSAFSR
jgi:hypothetical protein